MIHSEGLFSERPSISQLDQSDTLGTMLGISLVHLAHKYHCSIKYEKKVEKRDKKNKRCLYVKDQHIFCDKRL